MTHFVILESPADGTGRHIGPPYGYYHIRKVYDDTSWWTVGFIDTSLGSAIAEKITQLIADEYETVWRWQDDSTN